MSSNFPFWRRINKIEIYKLASQKIWSLVEENFKKSLKLDWNEGDNYMSRNIKKDLIKFIQKDCLNYYPNTYDEDLYKKLAIYNQCKKNNILITAGSDAASELIVKTIMNYKFDNVLICGPTYDNFRITLNQYNINYETIDFFKKGYLNIEKDLKNFTVVYIVRPNNPTGQLINKEFLIKIIKKYKNILFIIDEAYVEFEIEQSLKNEINRYDNIIITRTFSKAFGLAGFRIGYILSNQKIISSLIKYHNFKSVNSLALISAKSALNSENLFKLEEYTFKINQEKNRLNEYLLSLKTINKTYNNSGNFIFVEFLSKNDLFSFISILEKNYVFVRNYSHIRGYEKFCRITVTLNCTKKIRSFLND